MTGKQVTSGGYHHVLLMFFPTGYLPDLSLRVIPRPTSMLSHAHLPRQSKRPQSQRGHQPAGQMEVGHPGGQLSVTVVQGVVY